MSGGHRTEITICIANGPAAGSILYQIPAQLLMLTETYRRGRPPIVAPEIELEMRIRQWCECNRQLREEKFLIGCAGRFLRDEG